MCADNLLLPLNQQPITTDLAVPLQPSPFFTHSDRLHISREVERRDSELRMLESMPNVSGPSAGRRDLELGTPASKPTDGSPLVASSVTNTEPTLNIIPCISTAFDLTDSTGDTVSGVADARNGLSSASSQDEVIEFTEQISRARSGLVSASRHAAAPPLPPHAVTDANSEMDELWKQISLRVHQLNCLKIRDLDFSDLISSDDDSTNPRLLDAYSLLGSTVSTPPLPPNCMIPSPPPPPVDRTIAPPPPPPSLSTSTSSTAKTRKTMKLHWKEAKPDVRSVFGSQMTETIWTQMSREIGPVTIDQNKLEHLFETRTVDMKSKVSCVCLSLSHFVTCETYLNDK